MSLADDPFLARKLAAQKRNRDGEIRIRRMNNRERRAWSDDNDRSEQDAPSHVATQGQAKAYGNSADEALRALEKL